MLRVPAWTRASAGERRRARRVRKARSAARVFFDHVPRRRRSVRESRSARPRCGDGSDDERGHHDSRRRGAVERAAAARRRRSRPTSAASPARWLSSRPRESSRRRWTSSPTCCCNSTFPADALERLRQQRLVALAQARAQPGSIAARVFPRVLYGQAHPFGQPVTEESLKAITRDDVAAFHQAYFQPGRALISVVGDVQAATVRATVEKALAAWSAGGDKPAFSYPKRRRRTRRRSTSSTSPARHSRRLRSGFPGHRGIRRTSTRCRS